MSEEHHQHHHGHFHHKKEDVEYPDQEHVAYTKPTYSDTGKGGTYGTATASIIDAQTANYKGEVRDYMPPAAGFALHEKEPEDGHKHKVEDEEVAAAAGVGASGLGFHEKKEVKEE